MAIHLSAASVQLEKDGKHINCVAVLTSPGAYDAVCFIMPDGKPHTGKIWNYNLWPYRGAMSVDTDCAAGSSASARA